MKRLMALLAFVTASTPALASLGVPKTLVQRVVMQTLDTHLGEHQLLVDVGSISKKFCLGFECFAFEAYAADHSASSVYHGFITLDVKHWADGKGNTHTRLFVPTTNKGYRFKLSSCSEVFRLTNIAGRSVLSVRVTPHKEFPNGCSVLAGETAQQCFCSGGFIELRPHHVEI